MVLGGLVGGRGDDGDAVVVGVVDRLARELVLLSVPSASWITSDAVVDRVDDGLGEAVDVGDERVADPQRDEHAVRAGAARRPPLLASAVESLRLAGAVAVLDVVVGVVVVVEEVPAGDVVDEAVAVVVAPSEKAISRSCGSSTSGGPDARAGRSGRRAGRTA